MATRNIKSFANVAATLPSATPAVQPAQLFTLVNPAGIAVQVTQEQLAALFAPASQPAPTATVTPIGQPTKKRPGRKSNAQKAAEAAALAATSQPAIPVAAPTAQPVAPVVPAIVSDAERLFNAKVQDCYSAAKAAVKAAGLAWNGKKGAESKGGKFTPGYWPTFWAGYNAKARELGIPESNPPAKK